MRQGTKVLTALTVGLLVTGVGAGTATAAPVETESASGGSASADSHADARTTSVVGGGVWSYGVANGKVFSAYDNQRLSHKTSVKSSGTTKSSGWVAKGTVAYAERPSALSGNQSFWDIR